MEIRNTPKLDGAREIGNAPAKPDKPGPGTAAAGGETRAAGDRLTLTEAAQRLLDAERSEDAAPVDEARVEALRQAIAEGSYEIDSASIARKLLDLDNSGGA